MSFDYVKITRTNLGCPQASHCELRLGRGANLFQPGIAHFKLAGRRVGVENYAKMCGAAAVVQNLLAAGLNTNVLD